MVFSAVSAIPVYAAKTSGPAIEDVSFESVRPRYPNQQQRKGIGGTSVVQVVVDSCGSAREISMRLTSGNSGLDRAALRYVERLRFVPALRSGQPVEGVLLVPVNFTPADPRVADGTRQAKQWPALRPGFECQSAAGDLEKKLCHHAGLSTSELMLRDLYGETIAESTDPAVRSLVLDGHRPWLADRNRRCGADPDCLARDNRDRARYLRVLVRTGK